MSLAEIDLANPDHFVEAVPHHWFKRFRAEAPVYWHPEPEGPGFWCITKYEDLKHVSKHPQVFSSELGGTNIETPPEEVLQQVRAIMLNTDPPRHVKAVMVMRIQGAVKSDLPLVCYAFHLDATLPGPRQRGKKQSGQHGQNRNDDQQLNEGEPAPRALRALSVRRRFVSMHSHPAIRSVQ